MFRHCLISTYLLFGALVQSHAASCYPMDIPAPQIREQTLIVVDRTAYPDATARRDFIAAAQGLASRANQRLVILSFAGIAPGEALARDLDLNIEGPIIDDNIINNVRIAPFKKSQKCVAERLQEAAQQTRSILEKLLAPPEEGLARSEISWALLKTIKEFSSNALPTRLLIYSDGLQNGSGQSFYSKGSARRIDPDAELKKSLASFDNSIPERINSEGWHTWWWGLLAQAPRSTKRQYADAELLQSYETYWRKFLQQAKVKLEGIGLTLNNPRF